MTMAFSAAAAQSSNSMAAAVQATAASGQATQNTIAVSEDLGVTSNATSPAWHQPIRSDHCGPSPGSHGSNVQGLTETLEAIVLQIPAAPRNAKYEHRQEAHQEAPGIAANHNGRQSDSVRPHTNTPTITAIAKLMAITRTMQLHLSCLQHLPKQPRTRKISTSGMSTATGSMSCMHGFRTCTYVAKQLERVM